jgi:HSP20 family protein
LRAADTRAKTSSPDTKRSYLEIEPQLAASTILKGDTHMREVNIDRRRPEESGDEESRQSSLRRTSEGHRPMLSPWSTLSMSPFSLMRRMSEDMERMFSGVTASGDGISWSPAVEVTERDNSLVVRADLPGLNENDVKVEVTPEGLTIQGERKREQEERGAWGYRSERMYGTFCRTIPLPEGASVDQAKAEFKGGVLEVMIPVPEQQNRRRQIPITGASGERKPAAGEAAGQRQQESQAS